MPRLLIGARRLLTRAAALPRARGGNLNILFGLSLIPMVGLVGFGIDYGVASSDKSRLDSAADAAALAGVVTAKAYIAANPGQNNLTANAMNAGVNQATNAFNVNAGKVPFAQVTLQTPTVTRSGQTVTSSVSYTATIQNNFGKIFRSPTTVIANTATASTDLQSYLDIYLMVDVSGSMGLPATQSGMTQLAQVNKDMWDPTYKQGCQFACHFPPTDGLTFNGWNQAAGKIQLRSDAVNSAVCQLLQTASTPSVPNQYRIGIYPFINQLATLADIGSSTINSLNTQASCTQQPWPLAFTNLLDNGKTQLATGNDPTTGTGSGGTHFEVALPQMQTIIGRSGFGDGSSNTSRKPFVFLITDGMQNSQHFASYVNGQQVRPYQYPGQPSAYRGYAAADWDGSQPAQIDSSQCAGLKAAGATIFILYIPYNTINFIDRGDGLSWENNRVNGFSPTLSTPLQACASSSYFWTANAPSDITAALNAMFQSAVKVTRLTR